MRGGGEGGGGERSADLDEVDALLGEARQKLSKLSGVPDGESRVPVREVGDAGPGLVSGRAKKAEYLVDLIDF
jgi:hypothetical protein